MARHGCWLGFVVTLLGGCAQLPDYAVPTRSLAQEISSPVRETRAQMPDAPKKVQMQTPQPLDIPSPLAQQPIRPLDNNVQQTNFAGRGTVKVRVRAWVNGQPIFDNEVRQIADPEIYRMPAGLSDAQKSQKIAEINEKAIEGLMDQEVVYQDAIKKIQKSAPHALDKLKDFVELEFDKTLDRMRAQKVPENLIKEMEPAARRMMERNLVSTEYIRSRIKPLIEIRTGLKEVREYYETHLSEFRTVDKVYWQDIFIPVSANHPTLDDVQQFAEDLVNRCRTPEDFNKLIIYDALGKNGEGLGNLRGQIRPAELETHLFAIDPNRALGIGPVIPLGNGVHLIRVTKREVDGQMPLNDEVAKEIRKTLERDLADREYRRIVRELRARAVCRIEKD